MTALDAKRMQTFFNEFTKTTYTFLNEFVQDCENKFFILDRKLQKIETSLLLVEEKLSNQSQAITSKPEVIETKSIDTTDQHQPIVEENERKAETEITSTFLDSSEQEPPSNENMIKISESPIYKKYFMMLKVGIPLMAVKQKLHSEGLECDLENPNLMINKEEYE